MGAELYVTTPADRERVRALHQHGELVRVRRGWYTPRTATIDLARVRAAALALDAVVSHTTAAALLGIATLGRPDQWIHLTRPRRGQGTVRYPGVVVHHATLPEDHVTSHHGVPVTTPARTVVDLARRQPFRAGVVAADAALHQRHCTPEQLVAVLGRCRRWPKVQQARRVVGFADRRAASPLESISRVAFHEYGLPAPILQATIGGYEDADFLWPQVKVIGEADGLGKYTAPEVLRREKLREDGFAQLGFAVFRWTWSEAFRRPDALAHRGMQLLVRRGYRPT